MVSGQARLAEPAISLEWWTYIGSASDIVVAIAAVAGVIFGLVQLRRIASANRNQEDIARAELLLEVDARFESSEMQASRLAIRTLRNHCENEARTSRPGANGEEVANRSAQLFSQQLTILLQRFQTADPLPDPPLQMIDRPDDQSGDRYFTFMRLPYWMETVGLLTRANLLSLDDVLNMYDAAFIGVLSSFLTHIEDRRSAGPKPNPGFLEHALWLRERALDRQTVEKRRQDQGRTPKRGRIGG